MIWIHTLANSDMWFLLRFLTLLDIVMESLVKNAWISTYIQLQCCRLNVNYAAYNTYVIFWNLVKLVSHQSLLYNLAQISSASQMVMHSMTLWIFLYYCYYTYNIIIINISSWPIATDSSSFTISELITAAQAYFNLGISASTRKAYINIEWPPQI